MSRAIRLLGVILAGLIVGMVAWRVASRRRSLPCPPWLAWLLENPITEGTSGQKLLDYLELGPAMRVLDVGCGTGRLSIPVARRMEPTGSVVGIDIQAGMVQRAAARARQAGVTNVQLGQCRRQLSICKP
jgi:2-polyprenyl-3-methyl-5-hydroxy-6-metoxy-1,4-benzoquinol methylase